MQATVKTDNVNYEIGFCARVISRIGLRRQHDAATSKSTPPIL
jgi:hypothetical protein